MTEFSKLFDLTAFGKAFDLSAVIEMNQKTLETVKQANSIMAEAASKLAARQAEMTKTTMAEGIAGAKELTTAKGLEEYLGKQAQLFQVTLEKSVENSRELAELATKASTEAGELVTRQLLNNVSALSTAASKTAKAATAAAATAAKK